LTGKVVAVSQQVLTPRRNDARRNREVILRVADAAFADGRDVVSLDEIARRARLGRATVYRHFPNRHALAIAVAAHNLDALQRVVGTVEGRRRSFRDLLQWVLSTQATMRPLVTLMHELPVPDQRRYANTLIGLLTPPFRCAQVEGELRSDVKPADLVPIMAMVNAGVDAVPVGDDHNAAIQRLIAVILDGLFLP
jgi:AcrR family transcriptional regulator